MPTVVFGDPSAHVPKAAPPPKPVQVTSDGKVKLQWNDLSSSKGPSPRARGTPTASQARATKAHRLCPAQVPAAEAKRMGSPTESMGSSSAPSGFDELQLLRTLPPPLVDPGLEVSLRPVPTASVPRLGWKGMLQIRLWE